MLGKRILSTFLAIITLAGAVSMTVGTVAASAEEAANAPVYEYNTSKNTPTIDYLTGIYKPDPDSDKTVTVKTKEQKLQTMDLRLEQDGYRIYVDAYSGEVAVQRIETGDILFTNPYDVSAKPVEESKKKEMLSQILVDYYDTAKSQTGSYNSFTNAAGQINVKTIKNGIRVEYSIGRIDTRYLVPERISKEKFEKYISGPMNEAKAEMQEEMKDINDTNDPRYRELKNAINDMDRKLLYFALLDPDEYVKKVGSKKTEDEKAEIRQKYIRENPETKNGPVYKFTSIGIKKETKAVEAYIKQYCPDYSYEEMDAEHLKLNYKPADQSEALFKVALEYTVDANGLVVRLPANGIRFDESVYRLNSIEILPYMGAGMNPNEGYTFFPDGSGTLFDFQELAKIKTDTYFYGNVYGEDYAYYNIGTGAPHNEIVRYPVFGLSETVKNNDGTERSRGYLAVIEEGEAMTQIFSYHCQQYNSVRMKVNPRPYDEYKLSSAISAVGGDAKWTVVSDRKYTGNFKIRYTMLTDPDVKTGEGHYDTSYVGMAKVYRDYLVRNGVLSKLTAEDVKADIPLYIETFGAISTVEKFLSIPYNTMKPLTSFGDIKKMYEELSSNGVRNINFVLNGYTKGGLNVDQVPYNLKWDKAVRKDMKFEELVEYAKEKDFGIYPDFDFVFTSSDKAFDGLSLKKHAVRTIDGRYTSRREYSATRQTYVSYFELAISPAYFSHFYEKLTKNYTKYGSDLGISVSSLGKYLNSDFDEKEPYNREDSKGFTAEAFKYLDEHYSKVLTSGGNAYSWKYVDYITDISIDSSRHARSAATVPFLGMVLHGYKQIAGNPVNMEGNIDYAMLRAIENGASLKFILSYRNTEKLKELSDTNIYYSVRYDIWVNDLIERYNSINSILKDLQTSTIEYHKFVDGVRIPNSDEIELDVEKELLDAVQAEIDSAEAQKEELRATLQAVRKNLYDCSENIPATIDAINASYSKLSTSLTTLKNAYAKIQVTANALEVAKKALEENNSSTNSEIYESRLNIYSADMESLKKAYKDYMTEVDKLLSKGVEYAEKYELADSKFSMLDEYEAYSDEEIFKLDMMRMAMLSKYNELKTLVDTITAEKRESVADIEATYAKELGLNAEEGTEETTTVGFDKYAIAKNSIAYEVYENGRALVLNFNNYAVKVTIDGVSYTIGAYDYIVLK